MLKRTAVAGAAALAVGGLVMTSQPAMAQVAQRVEVTGSAIKRIDAESSVPVTVIKADDLRKEGITNVEQVMSVLSSVQMQQSTSQVVGAGTGGASFANLRGIGENKTLVLLNGRRIANNALDSSAPDLNMIPFAVIDRVEVLRDGASALYGTDAIGGVINFITKREYAGGTATLGYDSPEHPGGKTKSANVGFGYGDLNQSNFNVFGFLDYQKQERISGTQRSYNTRIPGGLSPTTFPANYFQGGDSGNPAAVAGCETFPNLISDGGTGCQITTASFVNYIPQSERISGMLKGTLKLTEDHQLGLEYFASQSKISSVIAPVPYGGLRQNRILPDGSLNPYYPGNPGSSVATPNIPLDPNYTIPMMPSGALPGYVNVRWRDLVNGSREDKSTNDQQRLVASLEGVLAGWDYQTAVTYNENKYKQALAGYSDGTLITPGVLNGIINPFGDQTADGLAYIQGAALSGTLQKAKGTVWGVDARASRELGDWLGAGKKAALAVGAEFRHEKFTNAAEFDFASKVIASTGIDPNTNNNGSRDVYAGYAELNVPILKTLDVTGAVRYDDYSDFGNTTNPKVSFRFQPITEVLVRGSYSTGFRAPSLYEINAAQTYTNTSQFDDPVNCPGGDPIAGKSRAANCNQQFQALFGGNTDLKPEKSRNATLGIVVEPVADLSVGLDFWWVKVRQQIGSLSDVTVFGDPATFANLYKRNPQGDLSSDGSQCPDPATCGYVDLRTQNLGDVRTNGIDVSGAYRLRTSTAGVFNFGLQSTYVNKYEYQDFANGPFNQNVAVYSGAGPIFRWQHNLSAAWSMGAYGAGLAVHYKSGYLDQDPTNTVGSYTTVDLFGSWIPVKNLSLTLGIRNLFDQDPPFSNQTAVFQAGYDPRYTDPTGRTYYVRGTYNF